jgi:hypothetical protein
LSRSGVLPGSTGSSTVVHLPRDSGTVRAATAAEGMARLRWWTARLHHRMRWQPTVHRPMPRVPNAMATASHGRTATQSTLASGVSADLTASRATTRPAPLARQSGHRRQRRTSGPTGDARHGMIVETVADLRAATVVALRAATATVLRAGTAARHRGETTAVAHANGAARLPPADATNSLIPIRRSRCWPPSRQSWRAASSDAPGHLLEFHLPVLINTGVACNACLCAADLDFCDSSFSFAAIMSG